MKKRGIPRWLLLGLFIVYLLLLFYFLFFAECMGRNLAAADGTHVKYNFRLFHEIRRYWVYRDRIGSWNVILNLAGNIIAFIPLGGFLYYLAKKANTLTIMLLSLIVSLAVETMQLYYAIGCFDVDDMFLNTIGGVLGYWLCYWLGLRSLQKRSEKG